MSRFVDHSDLRRQIAVDKDHPVVPIGARDKRTLRGWKRYVRRVGDHALLLAMCRGASSCIRAYLPSPCLVCPACGGAVPTAEEKRDAFPPG